MVGCHLAAWRVACSGRLLLLHLQSPVELEQSRDVDLLPLCLTLKYGF